MKKNIFKNILIIVLCLTIVFLLLNKRKYKFVFVKNEEKHICQKCAVINNQYYCQTFGIKERESDE